jgi:hypothetical protein
VQLFNHFRSRFREHREKSKGGNELISPPIERNFFSCRLRYQKEYSDTDRVRKCLADIAEAQRLSGNANGYPIAFLAKFRGQ